MRSLIEESTFLVLFPIPLPSVTFTWIWWLPADLAELHLSCTNASVPKITTPQFHLNRWFHFNPEKLLQFENDYFWRSYKWNNKVNGLAIRKQRSGKTDQLLTSSSPLFPLPPGELVSAHVEAHPSKLNSQSAQSGTVCRPWPPPGVAWISPKAHPPHIEAALLLSNTWGYCLQLLKIEYFWRSQDNVHAKTDVINSFKPQVALPYVFGWFQ